MYIYILLQQYKTVYRQLLYEGMTVCVYMCVYTHGHTHTNTYIYIYMLYLSGKKKTQKQ